MRRAAPWLTLCHGDAMEHVAGVAMKSWGILLFISLLWANTFAQECPDLIQPVNNQTNVPVNTSISWTEVIDINGYIISLGTTPGGTDIINEQQVGLETSFTPPTGLPESTEIFVTITLFFINQAPIVCPSQKFTTRDVTTVPDCTLLESPIDGEQGVSTATLLNWYYAPRAIGYRITIGTTPNGGEIANNLDVGNVLTYDPPQNLPPQSNIFVMIVPYNENGSAVGCVEEQFTTGGSGVPPGCTVLVDPPNGATNVQLSTIVSWSPVENSLGYIVSIGTSPTVNDVLDEAIFSTNFISVLNFEPNTTYYVLIVPFNEAGEAQGCLQESFSTILGCGPFFDPDTGGLVNLNPTIEFPDEVGLCEDSLPTAVSTTDLADGFRWYKLQPNGSEVLIGEGSVVALNEPGRYRYEAYNRLIQNGFEIECPKSKEFTAVLSSAPVIAAIQREPLEETFNIEARIQGLGDYELSLNSPQGPFTTEREFRNLPPGNYTLYVRDRNGCGIAQKSFKLAFPPPGFPPYFSPNSDGVNDFWQYAPPNSDPLDLVRIEIYDRYGKILASISPSGQGWDGTYNGVPLPAEGYWYLATDRLGSVYRGNFSIVR